MSAHCLRGLNDEDERMSWMPRTQLALSVAMSRNLGIHKARMIATSSALVEEQNCPGMDVNAIACEFVVRPWEYRSRMGASLGMSMHSLAKTAAPPRLQ